MDKTDRWIDTEIKLNLRFRTGGRHRPQSRVKGIGYEIIRVKFKKKKIERHTVCAIKTQNILRSFSSPKP